MKSAVNIYSKKIYELAKCDLACGKLDQVSEILKRYEEQENFEACAGIKKAIDEFKESKVAIVGDNKGTAYDFMEPSACDGGKL